MARLARLTGHLLDQPLHPPRLEKAGRRLGLRVRAVLGAFQRRQAGDLVLLVLGPVDAPALPGRPRPRPPSISTTTAAGVWPTRGFNWRRRRWSARASRCRARSVPTSSVSCCTWRGEIDRPVSPTAKAASAKESSRAAAVTICSRTAGE
jgi:hypothetical protein